jgi:HSP20 family protein
MASLQTELTRLLSGTNENARQNQSWLPPLDVWETEEAVTYAFELPGIVQEDISIEAEDGRLTVSATRTHSEALDSERFYRFESRYGTFSRTVGLPKGIVEDEIAASFENGILTVSVPKAEQPKPKRISINGNAPTTVDVVADATPA